MGQTNRTAARAGRVLAALAVAGAVALGMALADAQRACAATLSDGFGVTREQVVSHLRSHEGDGYYLGTPYTAASAYNNNIWPNGQPRQDGYTGMNCTGFVCRAIWGAGGTTAPIEPYTSAYPSLGVTGATAWMSYVRAAGVERYSYGSVAELLADGRAEKGDIVFFEPGDWPASAALGADTHIGFFWGDSPSDNVFWHSDHAGNRISALEPKWEPSVAYLLKTEPQTGRIDIAKESSEPALTDGNGCYSLAGAVYGVFRDKACTDTAAKLVLNAQGHATSDLLRSGQYWVCETVPASGYVLDPTVYPVVVESGKTAHVNAGRVRDVPQRGTADLWVSKVDAETGESHPLGSASLAGAEFELRYYAGFYESAQAAEASGDPVRTWVVRTGEDGHAPFGESSVVAGDELYRAADGEVVIPLGTVLVSEVFAPEGYLPDPTVRKIAITGEGSTEALVAYQSPVVPDRVKRGDLSFVKAHGATQERLANVPFALTSCTTGERHVLITDANGFASTEASWNAHSANTNGNDDAQDGAFDASAGVWFGACADGGTAPVDDGLGALPYDTYTLDELPCTANEGLELVSLSGISVSRDSRTVELGTVDDASPHIGTLATDASDGDKFLQPAGKASVTDEVSYANLIPGEVYTMTGTLMDKESGEPFGVAGQPVTASIEFTAAGAFGSVELELPLDASGIEGKELVVFERLERDGHTVAVHEDIADEGQTVLVGEPAPPVAAQPSPQGGHAAPRTGDAAWMVRSLLAAAGAAAFAAGACLMGRRSRHGGAGVLRGPGGLRRP